MRTALSALVDAYYPVVLQLLTRLCGSSVVAEELAQETFTGLARSWRPLDDEAENRAYVIRAAYNAWRRFGRALRPEPVEPGVLDRRFADRGLVVDEVCTREEVHRIYAALYRLPENQRAAFVLVVLQGMEYKEVASLMGVPRDTVSKWRARALHGIRAALTSPSSQPAEVA